MQNVEKEKKKNSSENSLVTFHTNPVSEVFHNIDGLKFSLVTTQWHLLIQKASNINGKLALPALPEIRTRNLAK
jgi:hypothetical protein